MQTVNGPVSSNSSVNLSGSFYGSIEAQSTTGTATGTQTIIAPAATKTMPSTTVFTDLSQNATTIPYNSIAGGNMQKVLLSSTSNPYGTPDPNGRYLITLGGNKNLTITNCRIVGTLFISTANKNNLIFQGPIEWEPGPAGGPILVVSGQSTQVTISGSNNWLSESAVGINLNPAGTPYQGTTDSDLTDDYPPQFRGIIHIMGGTSNTVTLNNNAYVVGTVIADCPVQTAAQVTVIQNPSIYANPPLGYATGNAMAEIPGTFRWDTLP